MSLELNLKKDKNAKAVAVLSPSKNIIYVQENIQNGIKEFNCDEDFSLLPNTKPNNRDVLFITGASGSGKSTFINSYAKQYIKLYPDNCVYVFSKFENDVSCPFLEKKQAVYVEHSKIRPDYSEIFDLNSFKNSLVIFDDVEAIINNDVKYRITQIMNMLLTSGRHVSCSMAISMHQSNNWNQTKLILNESTHAVFFPSSNFSGIQKYLRNNVGLIKNQIDKIKGLKSRWVCVQKIYPMFVLYEHGIYLL